MIKLIAGAVALAAGLVLAPVVHADDADDLGMDEWSANYARRSAGTICGVLTRDNYDGVPGISRTILGIQRSIGASQHQAVDIVSYSVITRCPEHGDRLHRWFQFYTP
ncbi:hypothetical protein [Mycobacteroides abscessus]